MNCERKRLNSFLNKWIIKHILPKDLANAGFFYLDYNKVQCAFCSVVVSNWDSRENPLRRHIRENPKCPFLLEQNVENIPFRKTACVLNDAKRQRMKSVIRRYESFSDWPLKQPGAYELARNGFFYSGFADVVICFFCEITLGCWDECDDPLYEHAKNSPDCGYLKRNEKSSEMSTDIVENRSETSSDVVGNGPEVTQYFRRKHSNSEGITFPQKIVPEAVKEKNERINQDDHNKLLCNICLDKEKSVLFQPCGHLTSCYDCSQLLTKCAICRKDISYKINVYLS